MAPINILLCATNLLCAGITAALAIPLIRGRVPMNRLYGVRFARSFESDELWQKINRYGARLALRWSIALAAVGIACLFVPLEDRDGLAIVLAFAPLVLVIPCWQAYRYSLRV